MKDIVEIPPHRPNDRELRILAEGFFGQQSMLSSFWVNWAIDYTHSDLPRAGMYSTCSLVEYYDYCQVLQRACAHCLINGD